MSSWVLHFRRASIHVFGSRESRGYPMHEAPQSVRTIYGR